ncbi:MAG: enoyl-CoA hydratase/isomerase family protein [Rhodoferax sp.]|nr:enoyl-CoA hydratase/isomerase family protein [Rhodoferax sp.]
MSHPIFTSTAELAVEQRGPVLWLTITREERRNAMSHGVLAAMAQAIHQAQHLRTFAPSSSPAQAPKPFAPGLICSRRRPSPPTTPSRMAIWRNCCAQRASTVPLIARVNGACMAGGMGLMSMCDMAVAASHAVFGLPEVKVGVFPAQVRAAAFDSPPLLAGDVLDRRAITAAQALQVGLVNYVDDDVDAKLQWLLARLLDKSPAAIRRGLYTLKKVEAMAFEESMAFTESQIALFTLTEDAQEGQKAFSGKTQTQLGRALIPFPYQPDTLLLRLDVL